MITGILCHTLLLGDPDIQLLLGWVTVSMQEAFMDNVETKTRKISRPTTSWPITFPFLAGSGCHAGSISILREFPADQILINFIVAIFYAC
jgi:hypothetical protein